MSCGSLTIALLLHLPCAVKSKCESRDVAAENTQLMLMRDRVRVWFNCVTSKANWSDGTSREAAWDSFRLSHVFFISGSFYAPLGLGASRTAPHLNFVPCVVWSSVDFGLR